MTALKLMTAGRKLLNIYNGLSAPICKRYGINQTCFDILLFCANNPENNTARDICELRGIKSGMASVATEMLIKKGFLRREDDARDRRLRRLTPTEKAAPIIKEGREMQRYFAEILTSGISAQEAQALRSAADKLILSVERFLKEEKQ